MGGLQFSFSYFEKQLHGAIDSGYTILGCGDFLRLRREQRLPKLSMINRVDIDFSCQKAFRQAEIFRNLRIPATFFIRLHAPEYNPFSFENYRIIKELIKEGFEIGLHSEIVDEAAIWGEDASVCLNRDIEVLNRMFEITLRGVASHGGMTGLNNLDFWARNKPEEFGIDYEAYKGAEGFNLFKASFYISDSEWVRWKCYNQGMLVAGDDRDLVSHCKDKHPLIYLLTHPDTYYERHPYE